MTWPAQADLPSDGTYSSKQVTGPRLRSTVCAQGATKPVAVTPVPGKRPTGTPTSDGGNLAATGLSAPLSALAVAVLLAAAALRRRRVGTLSA